MQLVLLTGIGMAARAQGSEAESLFTKELKEKCSGINSIECRFVQTRSSSVLAQDADKEGRYYFLQPYNILLAFDDGDYIKINSTMFEMRQNGQSSSTRVSSNPMLKSLNKMLTACISGDASQILAGNVSEITAGEDEFILRMQPQRGRSGKKTETLLIFDRADMALKLMKIQEPSGDFLQYRFFDVVYNSAVDPSLFEIK